MFEERKQKRNQEGWAGHIAVMEKRKVNTTFFWENQKK
jgi:hypothetical protein